MLLYHGSTMAVRKPIVSRGRSKTDFGKGFYTTTSREQAEKWAKIKRDRAKGTKAIVSVFEIDDAIFSNRSYKIMNFDGATKEWLDFVVACRRGESHDYDIVEGPMADDTIWDYVEDFIAGNITREAFWVLVKFKYPTHQLVFCTATALRTLSFINSYAV